MVQLPTTMEPVGLDMVGGFSPHGTGVMTWIITRVTAEEITMPEGSYHSEKMGGEAERVDTRYH